MNNTTQIKALVTAIYIMAALLVLSTLVGTIGGYAIGRQEAQGRAIAAPFTDISGHPYAWAIEAIRLAGLTAGCSTDPSMYCPDRPLTRGEAAVFLARMLER